jgi:acyl carrier protein
MTVGRLQTKEPMATPSIAERIESELANYLKRDRRTITPAYSMRDDLGLDSMATIELLFRIEEAFDLQIPDQDLQKLLTVGDVIHYVEAKVGGSKPAKARPKASSRASKPSTSKPRRTKNV